MSRVRPVFAGLLAVTVVAAGAGVTASAVARGHDRADLRHAQQVARAMPLPPGATVSHECHGDGMVRCFTMPAKPTSVAPAVGTALSTAAGRHVGVACVGLDPQPTGWLNTCQLAVRWGDRGVFVFIDAHESPGPHGHVRHDALVAVSAS